MSTDELHVSTYRDLTGEKHSALVRDGIEATIGGDGASPLLWVVLDVRDGSGRSTDVCILTSPNREGQLT